MKLKEGFITYAAGEEHILTAAGSAAAHFRGIARSNATAAFIIDSLKQETTADEITDRLFERYDAPRDVIYRDVLRELELLRSIGALDE